MATIQRLGKRTQQAGLDVSYLLVVKNFYCKFIITVHSINAALVLCNVVTGGVRRPIGQADAVYEWKQSMHGPRDS